MSNETRYGIRNLKLWEHNEVIFYRVAEVLKQANQLMWNEDYLSWLVPTAQCPAKEFKEALASFLSWVYGSDVNSNTVTTTYGASNGLSLISSLLFPNKTVAFVEDKTYGRALELLRNHHYKIVSVTLNEDGVDAEEFENLIKEHCSTVTANSDAPYSALVYFISSLQNPTGWSFSSECCKKVVNLARKYNLLVVCDDVYNAFMYTESKNDVPIRLFQYDNRFDKDYGIGHVISNGTFSKILAPSLRIGWLEAPEWIIDKLIGRFGNIGHYLQGLLYTMIRHNLLIPFVEKTREFYKARMDLFCKTLKEKLPPKATFRKPKGGFFVWLKMPGINAEDLLHVCQKKHNIVFGVGNKFSATGNHADCARLCIATPHEDELIQFASTLASEITLFYKS